MLNEDIIKAITQGASDQKTLLERLKVRGHNLTQSNISRKLKQLGVTKFQGKYHLPKIEERRIISVAFTEPNLFVIRTIPGHAASIASLIDEHLVVSPEHPEFVGTIAGDDTIFLAVDISGRNYSVVMAKLKPVIGTDYIII